MNPVQERKEKRSPMYLALLLLLFVILATSFGSCSVSNEFAKYEKELCAKTHNAYVITRIDEKKFYYESYPDREIKRSELKGKYFKYKVGDLVLKPVLYDGVIN